MALVKELLALNLRKKWGFSQKKLATALNIDIFQLFIPPYENNDDSEENAHLSGSEDAPELFLYNRVLQLRTVMKGDIDKRLDQFYLSEKSTIQN